MYYSSPCLNNKHSECKDREICRCVCHDKEKAAAFKEPKVTYEVTKELWEALEELALALCSAVIQDEYLIQDEYKIMACAWKVKVAFLKQKGSETDGPKN